MTTDYPQTIYFLKDFIYIIPKCQRIRICNNNNKIRMLSANETGLDSSHIILERLLIQGDRREPDVFEMASRRLLCEVGWGTSGRWPRYTMPFQ